MIRYITPIFILFVLGVPIFIEGDTAYSKPVGKHVDEYSVELMKIEVMNQVNLMRQLSSDIGVVDNKIKMRQKKAALKETKVKKKSKKKKKKKKKKKGKRQTTEPPPSAMPSLNSSLRPSFDPTFVPSLLDSTPSTFPSSPPREQHVLNLDLGVDPCSLSETGKTYLENSIFKFFMESLAPTFVVESISIVNECIQERPELFFRVFVIARGPYPL